MINRAYKEMKIEQEMNTQNEKNNQKDQMISIKLIVNIDNVNLPSVGIIYGFLIVQLTTSVVHYIDCWI